MTTGIWIFLEMGMAIFRKGYVQKQGVCVPAHQVSILKGN